MVFRIRYSNWEREDMKAWRNNVLMKFLHHPNLAPSKSCSKPLTTYNLGIITRLRNLINYITRHFSSNNGTIKQLKKFVLTDKVPHIVYVIWHIMLDIQTVSRILPCIVKNSLTSTQTSVTTLQSDVNKMKDFTDINIESQSCSKTHLRL